MTLRHCWLGTLAAALLAGCTPKAPPVDTKAATAPKPGDDAKASVPVDPNALQFWHTQTQENEKALVKIVEAYNAQPGVTKVQATYIGNYDQIYEKIRAGLHAKDTKALPDLAVAYESMVADYMAADAVRPLDDLYADPKLGFDAAAQADLYPAYLDMNKYPQFGGKLLSFPFTKSLLLLYVNTSLLDEVGKSVPKTWAELAEDCKAIQAKHPEIKPFSFFKDASAWDGIFLSFGGKLLEPDGSAGFGEPATKEAMAFFAQLAKDKLLYEPTDKGKQNNDFAQGKCAFFLRSSTARPDIGKLVANNFKWDVACLPSKAGVDPVTVLFGANICVFKSQPDREKAAWQFIKYFASPEVTAEWAVASGYLPVRKSALDTQTIKGNLAASAQNARPFEVLPHAVAEPNVAGWQDVRKAIEKAHMGVVNALDPPETIATLLDAEADAALAKAKAK